MAIFDIPAGALRRNIIPVGIAAALGVVAWFGIGPLLTDDVAEIAPPPPAPPPAEPEPAPLRVYPNVLVASDHVARGVMLTADMVAWQEWREPLELADAVIRDVVPLRAILGAVTTRRVEPGEPVIWDGILVPGHPGFISAVLTPGMLGITVEADRATTRANIIHPGDFVDVILVTTGDAAGLATRTVAQGTRVLAVGSMVMALGRYGTVSVTQAGEIVPPERPNGDNYTLEVTQGDAERIALAASIGRITLGMRSTAAAAYTAGGATAPIRLSEVMPQPDGPSPLHTVRVIRGAETTTERPEART